MATTREYNVSGNHWHSNAPVYRLYGEVSSMETAPPVLQTALAFGLSELHNYGTCCHVT